jgi:chromosome segregation ATPase
VTDLQGQFELVEFEHVEAAPGTALLRLAARPSPTMGPGPLILVITDGDIQHRHEQLPALPGPPGLIRAAFSAPLNHVAPGASYSLELPNGEVVRLPAPSRRRPALGTPAPTVAGAAATPVASEPPAEDHEQSRLVEAERRAESRRLAISELERRLQSERERRSAAESDMAFLRSERDEARAERDAAVADRDEAVADRDQAEARARAAAASAGTLEAQIRASSDSATREQAGLEAQLADRTAEIERIRTAAEVAQARAHTSRQEVTALDEQLAHAQGQISVMQQALEERESERASATAALDGTVASARAESTAARERVVSLQEELTSLREIAEQSDAQHTYDLETAQARIDVAQADAEAARTDTEALRHYNAELESTLAELDAALATRAAEIELLRVAAADASAQAPAGASPQPVADPGVAAQFADALAAANARADAAEAALSIRTTEIEEFGDKVREQLKDVQRSREDLVAAAEQTQAELNNERNRADSAEAELVRLQSAASTVVDELKNASAAVQAETEKRIRAEEALVTAAAHHALTAESLALEASRRDA